MSLTPEQKQVVDYVEQGFSMFVSGPGGVGKSFLINHIASSFEGVAVTAMTGCAATLLGETATTLHSWAGLGIDNDNVDLIVSQIRIRKKAQKWRECRMLIIDEISMLTGKLLDTLNVVAKKLRKSQEPFGGIQLLLFGDLLQLPPVVKSEGFAFESEAWTECIQYIFNLKKIIRQSNRDWQLVLNKIRKGVFDQECYDLLCDRVIGDQDPFQDDPIKPTILFCRKVDVDEINMNELARLGKPIRTFSVVTNAGADAEKLSVDRNTGLDSLDKLMPYSTELKLAVGAQVMLLINLNPLDGLVNGSRGVVTDFVRVGSVFLPSVMFNNGKKVLIEPHEWTRKSHEHVTKIQLPLKLAWACTIHKSQGQTLDKVLVDCGSSVFEYGQIYVALSRVKDVNSLYLTSFDPTKIMAHPKILEFYENNK